MKTSKLAKELDAIMEAGLQDVFIPWAKGNSIRIKNTVIRRTKQGYLIFDVKDSKRIADTFSKRGAIAYARCVSKNRKDALDTVLELDMKLGKHYMDSIFAKSTIEKTRDSARKDSAMVRFDIAKDYTWHYVSQLDDYIFDD
jgi:hypothetical protein